MEDGQGTAEVNLVWEILWKFDVPSKVIFFTWKAHHGTIPAYAMLEARHILVSPQYPVCKAGAGNIGNLLLTCERDRQVWKSLRIHDIIEEAFSSDKSGVHCFGGS